MRVLDASAIIYAWDNYPPQKFEKLWMWLAVEIGNKLLCIPTIALEEVDAKTPECAKWLKAQGIRRLEITDAMLRSAMAMKDLIGVKGEKYHPKGVGENDLMIIAAAQAHGAELISEEQRQATIPKEPAKRKIPAVLQLAACESLMH